MISEIDECVEWKVNCQNNGVCEDKVNGFTCNCATGFDGEFCENSMYHFHISKKTSRYYRSSVVGYGSGSMIMQKALTFSNISVITEYIYLKLRQVVYY